MSSPEILRRLVRRFGLLLLLTAVGAGAGAAYGALRTPTYTAKAYVVATGERGESVAALNFAQAYGRIATSGPVLARAQVLLAGDRRGLTDVTAETSPDAPVVEVTATGTSAVRAAQVANAVADALVDYGGGRRAETNVSLSVLAGATVPARPTSPKPPMETAVGAAAGLLTGGLAVLAGVGRASAARARDARGREEAAREEPAEFPASPPEPRPAEIEQRYTGVARPGPARAITAYRAGVPTVYLAPPGGPAVRETVPVAPRPVPAAPPVPAAADPAPDGPGGEQPEVDGAEPAVTVPRIVGRAVVTADEDDEEEEK